jgi:SPP1 family phage portal protein
MATGAYIKQRELELLGRKRIYTDANEITLDNVFEVLEEAWAIHEINLCEILYLLEYEKGMQPLQREKTIRTDIDIQVADNLANQITEFKLGYNWGNPITYVQKNMKDLSGNPPAKDDDAITTLNEMNDAEAAYAKDQELARFIEICGIGYQMVDVKRNYDGGSVFDLHVLHPMYTFVVYKNDIAETPMMGVTFRELESGDRYFTCYTKDKLFEVKNMVTIVNGEKKREWAFRYPGGYVGERNPLGMVPIVEFVRAYDRMGCFERQISDMDALNIEVSDFANATAQTAQEIWWGNDWEFPKDPQTGKEIKPKSGQWVMTRTLANGKSPIIKPLATNFDYDGVQENIVSKRNAILQKCYVPLQTDPGGGSTASAMSLSSGWAAAEAAASKEEQIIRRSKMMVIALELAAVKVRSYWLNSNPITDLALSDIYAKFTRQKTYDLGTKTNAMVAMIKSGVHGRIAMQTVDLFADVAQAWNDSKETIEKFQDSLFVKKEDVNVEEKRETADLTDQTRNSPILDGMNTSSGGDD